MDLQTALQVFDLENIEGLTLDKLKISYRRLAKQTHPDSQGGSSQEFVKLRQAFLYLSKNVPADSDEQITPPQTITDLEPLSKDEVVNKYLKQTQVLQSQLQVYATAFEEQGQIMDEVKAKVENIVADFDKQKSELQKELEKEISKLEKNYSPSVLKKLFFFLPQLSEKNFWKSYHTRIESYSRKHLELDLQFFRTMVEAYGGGLNQIASLPAPKEEMQKV